jgi:hypothetical protein
MAVGDLAGGGIVFYDSGVTLVAAFKDIELSLYWGCYKTAITGTSTAIGTGAANTTLIIAGCVGNTMIAANVCNNFEYSGYTDWYLPSKDELNELYLQKSIVGGFNIGDNYWSSSQYTPECAWMQFFGSGVQNEKGDKDQLYRVRPIRTL